MSGKGVQEQAWVCVRLHTEGGAWERRCVGAMRQTNLLLCKAMRQAASTDRSRGERGRQRDNVVREGKRQHGGCSQRVVPWRSRGRVLKRGAQREGGGRYSHARQHHCKAGNRTHLSDGGEGRRGEGGKGEGEGGEGCWSTCGVLVCARFALNRKKDTPVILCGVD